MLCSLERWTRPRWRWKLFPERVVRKCATDRALAKIHGLRDQLWMRRADGRWQARLTPMETLIRAKSSPHLALVPPTAADAPEPPPPRSRRKRGAATR